MRTARPAGCARGAHPCVTKSLRASCVLPLPVQDADQRKQAARGFEVDPHLALQPLLQRARAFVMDTAPAHVDRLDLVGRSRADRLVVAVADHEIILHNPTEREWASKPSALPKVIAAGPSARNWSGPHLRIEVRFMKSSTPSPDENRAERAVGST